MAMVDGVMKCARQSWWGFNIFIDVVYETDEF